MMPDSLSGARLLTAILPKGVGLPVLRALRQEKGVVSANLNFARGTGRMTHRAYRSKRSTETEKEVLTVIVPSERAEEIFDFVYETAGIGEPHGGLLYQTHLHAASLFTLPDLPEEA